MDRCLLIPGNKSDLDIRKCSNVAMGTLHRPWVAPWEREAASTPVANAAESVSVARGTEESSSVVTGIESSKPAAKETEASLTTVAGTLETTAVPKVTEVKLPTADVTLETKDSAVSIETEGDVKSDTDIVDKSAETHDVDKLTNEEPSLVAIVTEVHDAKPGVESDEDLNHSGAHVRKERTN